MKNAMRLALALAISCAACGDADSGGGTFGTAQMALDPSSCPIIDIIQSIQVDAQRVDAVTPSGASYGHYSSFLANRAELDAHCEDPTAPLGALSDLYPGVYRVRVMAFDQQDGLAGFGDIINDQGANPQLQSVLIQPNQSVLLEAVITAAVGRLVLDGGLAVDNESFEALR